MAGSFPSQIERRPMTSKQVRRRWQMNGCPTISAAERRLLRREAELESRAQKIREDEKRKKENARKRKEKEEHDKETKKRMGYQEEIKRPEGQLGLSQFLTRRSTRATTNTSMAQQDESPDELEQVDPALVENDVGENSVFIQNEHEEEEDFAEVTSETNEDIRLLLSPKQTEKQQPDDEVPSVTSAPQGSKHWLTTPKKWKQNVELEKNSSTPQPIKQYPQVYRSLSSYHPLTGTAKKATLLDKSFQEIPHHPAPTSSSQTAACEQGAVPTDSVSSIDPILTRDRLLTALSSSSPSSLLKRNLEQAGFDPAESRNDKDVTPSPAPPNKKPKILSSQSQASRETPPQNSSAVLHYPKTAILNPVVSLRQSDIHEAANLDDTTSRKSIEARPSVSTESWAGSFLEDLLNEDFDELYDADSFPSKKHVKFVQDTSQAEIQKFLTQTVDSVSKRNWASRGSDKNFTSPITTKKTPECRHCSPRKTSSSRGSRQSYPFSISSQDYANLEEHIKTPQQLNETAVSHLELDVQLQSSQSTEVTSSFGDSFGLPGCTQALVALIDPSAAGSQSPSPVASRKISPSIKAKATMLPPSPPNLSPLRCSPSKGNKKRLSAQSDDTDDMFNCFAGSTQALLDL